MILFFFSFSLLLNKKEAYDTWLSASCFLHFIIYLGDCLSQNTEDLLSLLVSNLVFLWWYRLVHIISALCFFNLYLFQTMRQLPILYTPCCVWAGLSVGQIPRLRITKLTSECQIDLHWVLLFWDFQQQCMTIR